MWDRSNNLCRSALTKERGLLAASVTANGDNDNNDAAAPASLSTFFPQIGEIFLGRQPVPDITLFLRITVFKQALFLSR